MERNENKVREYSKETYKWGSFRCEKFRTKNKCDFCLHVNETSYVYSLHYRKMFKIRGHLRHDYSEKDNIRWFVYLIEDIICMKQYIGSTVGLLKRWANHKSECNLKNVKTCRTGLTKHFINGCNGDNDKLKSNLTITMIDYLDTTENELKLAHHKSGPNCTCEICKKLRRIECSNILKLGTICEQYGLNSKDELNI